MLCHCTETCFTYVSIKKISGNKIGKFTINKCSTLKGEESKKKKKCDFFSAILVDEFSPTIVPARVDLAVKTETKMKKSYLEQVHKYIDLYEIGAHLFEGSKINYIANINHILKKMNYNLFFEENETISELKSRLNGHPDNKTVRSSFKTKIVLRMFICF